MAQRIAQAASPAMTQFTDLALMSLSEKRFPLFRDMRYGVISARIIFCRICL